MKTDSNKSTNLAETLPAHLYRGTAAFERERQAIFRREWILCAHESELAEPGSTIAECLAGWPIFVRRGRDGVLRAFHDACRHRAGPIVGMPEGDLAHACNVARLRCQYHGWLYDEQGCLAKTPDFGATELDREQYGLQALQVDTWRGFVFVCLDLEAPPLIEALGRLPELTDRFEFEGYQLHTRRAHRLQCNWKTYVENYLEGYHIPYVHPRLHREVDVQRYEVEAERGVVTHRVPARTPETVYDGLWTWLFPNVALNVYREGLSIERMMPVSPNEMRIEYLFLFTEGADPDASMEMSAEVTEEDKRICEAVQRNLDAGIYHTGRLSPKHETGVLDFQQRVRSALEQLPE